MISSEQAQNFLKQHEPAELQPVHFEHLPTAYRRLAEIIMRHNNYGHDENDQEIFVAAFGEDPAFNPWQSTAGRQLSVILFGAPKAHLVAPVWSLTRSLPYQTGYSRRPFRRKPEANPLERRLDRMRQLYQTGRIGFAGLDVLQTARYGGYYPWQAPHLALWYAAALNDPATATELRALLADIIAGEDEIGVVDRGIIGGLLTTDAPQNWLLVEQLLLAAQRQEGLRQSILESLDETSPGALFHFIELILEHDLARFSAVVRAVDTWFGFGWEAPKKATVNRVLTLARGFLAEPELVPAGLADQDSLVTYVALWSLAVTNVDAAILEAVTLLEGTDRTKRLLALKFLSETELTHPRVGAYLKAHFGKDLEADYWLLLVAPKALEVDDKLFERMVGYGESLPKDGKTFAGSVFSWLTVTPTPYYFYDYLISKGNKEHLRRLCREISQLPSNARERLLRAVFPDHYSWSLHYGEGLDRQKARRAAAEDWKRELIRQAATDRNGGVMATGVRFLGVLELEPADRELIIDLLRRKGKDLRAQLIKVILDQDDGTTKAFIGELLAGKSVDQRLAGLEIMTVLYEQNRLMTYVLAQHARYRQREKFTKNEEVLLARFDAPLEDEISFANGFGVIRASGLTPLIEPEAQFGKAEAAGLGSRLKSAAANIVNRATGSGPAFRFPELVDTHKTRLALNDLLDLLNEHGKLEYEVWYNDNYSAIVLLENYLGLTDPKAFALPPAERLDFLPLADVWRGWYERAGLNDFELLFTIHALDQNRYSPLEGPFRPFLAQYKMPLAEPTLKGTPLEQRGLLTSLTNVLGFFLAAFADQPTLFKFGVELLEDMIARLPEKLRQTVTYDNAYGYQSSVFWAREIQQEVPGKILQLNWASMPSKDPEALKRLWQLQQYLLARTLVPGKAETSMAEAAAVRPEDNLSYPTPDLWLTVWLHDRGVITDDDLLLASLHLPGLFKLLNGNHSILRWQRIDDLEVPEHLMLPLRKNLLELELKRGDLATDATQYVSQLDVIEGMDYLFRTLERMGKETFHRGYAWGREASLKVSFSAVVRKSIASATDTAPAFSAQTKQSQLTDQRMLEVAMYAPQWAGWIAEHLGIKDLEIAVWWFHAHASDYMDAHKEKIVAHFSPIAKEDFAQGAIDIDWFYAAYNGVGKKNWKLLHEAAKYISDGNGHRQVKTYSAVMLGEVKITETLKKIKEKRDKVYVKALGLIPFSRNNPEADVLRRYNLLQAFIRESKQYGAQRQESEKNAARIGLDNLARNAGHDDTVRFGWIMEAEATRDIMAQSLVGIDNVTLQLIIDEAGQPEILIAKDGKPQKSIPAKLRKHKAVLLLKEHKANLRRQFSRTRQSLEQAMLAGVTFTAADLTRINGHPIVRPLLGKLVLLAKDRNLTGFWRDGQLVDATGQTKPLAADDQLVIAHPAHLYQLVEWDRYQRYAFDQELVQPFKQIFRELYLLTKDEREEKIQSLRYQGHQIQPRKAAALLRTRGWTVSDSEGLQRVFHRQDIIATMYAVADWFSPSDVEAPVIEGVTFQRRRGEYIPLTELDPVLFSEVMRDIDLVVSIAHVGGVDPEASHSTLQMRAALARESARLFKADNVEVLERHIVIAGKHGSYNVHLGSGMVSKGGLQLNLIAVQSQHRGRLFLPFLDDDPKSAEIISKMKLLAEDDRIKDPTVLAQILS